jgi:hypothetical protein
MLLAHGLALIGWVVFRARSLADVAEGFGLGDAEPADPGRVAHRLGSDPVARV